MLAIPLLFLALVFAGVAKIGDNQPTDAIIFGAAAALCVIGAARILLLGWRR
jgi:hypothetical protein